MNKPIIYYRKGRFRRLSLVQELVEKLLHALEEREFEEFQGQSMEALRSLLQALNEAIQMHEEEELKNKNSLSKRG